MNKHALRKQMLLACVTLAISAIALCSATYAWFAANRTIDADGISMSAQTDGTNFEISIDKDSFTAGQTTASFPTISAMLLPVHPVIKTTGYAITEPSKWYHALSDSYDDAKAEAVQTEVTLTRDDINHVMKYNGNNYALVASYYLRLGEGTAEGVSIDNVRVTGVSITATGLNATNLKDSIRVMAATNSSAVICKNGDTTSDVIITKIDKTDTDPHRIDVYAYFEGTDASCKNSNYDNLSMDISITFEGDIS